jgi:hypothetical protein
MAERKLGVWSEPTAGAVLRLEIHSHLAANHQVRSSAHLRACSFGATLECHHLERCSAPVLLLSAPVKSADQEGAHVGSD